MQLKLLPLFILLFPAFCNAQYIWHNLPTAPTSYRFDDFYFTDPNHGWAINPNYDYVTPTQPGRIFKTIDGGNNWIKLVDSSNTFFRSVGFADTLNGWVGNIADTATYMGVPFTRDTIPLYETHDGGSTWSAVNLPHPHPRGICGISVITDSVVFAYGRYFGPAGYVKTTDKGATWTYTGMDSLAIGLVDGHFFNKDTGYITGTGADNRAMILYTTNGGASWRYVYHSTRADTEIVWKISFPSRNIGYASIEYTGYYHYSFPCWFLKTTDGGLTWVEHTFYPGYNEEGIGFINDSVGWIGGDNWAGTFATFDGGNTWSPATSFGVSTPPYMFGASGYAINRFRAFGDTLMYASGNTIYKLNVGSTGLTSPQFAPFELENYPNPFDQQTTISYTLATGASNIKLVVRNVLGKEFLTENLGVQSAGKHDYLFMDQLPEGMYFYTISSDNFSETKKMVISR